MHFLSWKLSITFQISRVVPGKHVFGMCHIRKINPVCTKFDERFFLTQTGSPITLVSAGPCSFHPSRLLVFVVYTYIFQELILFVLNLMKDFFLHKLVCQQHWCQQYLAHFTLPNFSCLQFTLQWPFSSDINIKTLLFYKLTTAWKLSKYGVITGPYFPELTPYLDTFHAMNIISALICLILASVCYVYGSYDFPSIRFQ